MAHNPPVFDKIAWVCEHLPAAQASAAQAQDTSTNSTPATSSDETVQAIERLTMRVMRAMQSIDQPESFAFLTSITTPRIRIAMPQDPQAEVVKGTAVPREKYLGSLVEYKKRYPDWNFEIWNMTTKMAENELSGEVWMTVSANVNESGLQQHRELLQKIHWVYQRDRWAWYGADGMFGPPQMQTSSAFGRSITNAPMCAG
jgi:hypothetical protein